MRDELLYAGFKLIETASQLSDLLIQALGGYAVELCELGVEHDLQSSKHADRLRDSFDQHDFGRLQFAHVTSLIVVPIAAALPGESGAEVSITNAL